ncbi:MAG: thiamine-phosphate kinase [Candidatus Accumulibacter sp.]|nr:thiamine-phosphate kinase [Accumulibacter sp.]
MPSEFELIRRHFTRPTPQALLGPGDDCALLVPSEGMLLAVTTDMLVEGTHFLPNTDPGALGWKTLAVSLSDLAAMGARPRWALLAGSLPADDELWIAQFAAGLFACAGHHTVDVVGGDTTRGPRNLCLTAIGELPSAAALRRDRALPGDDLWLSGQTGLAALGLAHLQGRVNLGDALRDRCVAALQRPLPRVELGIRLRDLAHAAIDVSDGLLADLGHVVEQSQVGAEIFLARLPPLPATVERQLALRCQLAGGDDYELLFTAAANRRHDLAALASELQVPLSRCGRIVATPVGEVRVVDEGGRLVESVGRGFDHFA